MSYFPHLASWRAVRVPGQRPITTVYFAPCVHSFIASFATAEPKDWQVRHCGF